MIINGVTTVIPPSIIRNGNINDSGDILPTAKFQIKQQSNNNIHDDNKNNGSIIKINNNNNNVDDDDIVIAEEYAQNIQIEHNNDNDDDDHHYHLHVSSGHNSSLSTSSQQELYNNNIDDNNDDDNNNNDNNKMMKKSIIINNQNGTLPLINNDENDLIINNNNNNNNKSTPSSCMITINGDDLNQMQKNRGTRKLSTASLSSTSTSNHKFHKFFNPSTSTPISSSTTTTTLAETTISSNLSLNDHTKKSWKLILCSWILTLLAILIIIGISFACGLLVAQYFYKSHCDLSSFLSSNKNHLLLENNNDNIQRTGRFNRIGHDNLYGNITNETLETTTPLTTIKLSENDIKKIIDQPIPMVIYVNDDNNSDHQSFNNINNNEDDVKIVPTTTTTTLATTTESEIDDEMTTTTTISPYLNFEQQRFRLTTSPQPLISESPLGSTTTVLPASMAEETTTTASIISSTTNPTDSVSADLFTSLIDEFNQTINDTIKQTDLEANDVFFPPTTTDFLPMEFLESNKTEIAVNSTDNDNDVMMASTTTTMIPLSSSTSSPSFVNETNYSVDPSIIDDNIANIDDNITNIDDNTTKIDNDVMMTTTEFTTLSSNDTNSEVDWSIPTNNDVDKNELDTTTTTLTPLETTTIKTLSTITRRTVNENEENSTFTSIDDDEDDKIIDYSINNNTDISLNIIENNKTTTSSTTTTTIAPENNRFARIVTNEHDDKKLNQTKNLSLTDIDSSTLCLETQFQCPNSSQTSECLDKSRICDGIVDCIDDHFDELNCQQKNCGQNFLCGRTTPPLSEFDTNETLPLNNYSIQLDSISMKTKSIVQCIPRSHYCDGIWDCYDGSDEINCHIDKCEPGKVLCRDNSACITGKQACDGVYNCRDRSDEAGCGTKSSCESNGKFYCDDSALCISKSLVCDGIADCPINGADEKDCPKPETCRAENSKFFCQHSNECIDRNKRCDGNRDCLDYSDEDRCFESDLDDYVYAFNSKKNHWSLLCVEDSFNHNDANKICMKLGMSYALNYTTIKISHLLDNSTWALVSNSTNYDKIDSFTDSCLSNLTIKIECEKLYCDSHIQMKKPNLPIETPDEIPQSIFIYNSTMINTNNTNTKSCLAYALSPNWLLTSGECLMNLKFVGQKLTINISGNYLSVKNVRLHPKYSIFRTIRFADYDMALIELNDMIPEKLINHFSICLPSTKLDPDITCFIGNYRNNDTAFKVLESSYCNSTKHFSGSITNHHVCANEDIGNVVFTKPGSCLPPYLPLICLSSQSHWYIAGYSSYQHGCDPITGDSKFRGYSPHPTLFSYLFSMKSFIDQTLGQGTYRQKRLKLNDEIHNVNHHHLHHHTGTIINERPNLYEERRSTFIVSGSIEDQQWSLKQQQQLEQQQQQQDARQQKSLNINKNITFDVNTTSTTMMPMIINATTNENSIKQSNDKKIETTTAMIMSKNDTEIMENNNDENDKSLQHTTTTIKPNIIDDDNLTISNNETSSSLNLDTLLPINESSTDLKNVSALTLSNIDEFIDNITANNYNEILNNMNNSSDYDVIIEKVNDEQSKNENQTTTTTFSLSPITTTSTSTTPTTVSSPSITTISTSTTPTSMTKSNEKHDLMEENNLFNEKIDDAFESYEQMK